VDARADRPTAAVWDRPFAIAGRFEIFPFPMSDALVVVDIAPARFASLEVGAGASIVQHPLFLAAAHLQAPFGHWAPGVEGGLLTGPLRWSPGNSTNGFGIWSDAIGYDYHEQLDTAVFVRAGLSMSYRSAGHVHLRIHGGVTALPERGGVYCPGDHDRAVHHCFRPLRGIPSALPYLGVTIGYAFDR